MMNEVIRGRWAGAYANADFICVETWSGCRNMDRRDYKGRQNLLAPSASDEELGLSVLDALASSRWVLPVRDNDGTDPVGVEYDMEQYDYKLNTERNAQWTKALMDRYNYKTKQAQFKDLENCQIAVKRGVMKIIPLRHAKLELWEGLGPNNAGALEIPADSSPAEIGAALRLAFTRCIE